MNVSRLRVEYAFPVADSLPDFLLMSIVFMPLTWHWENL
jgi:hypothetical protein